MPSSATTIFSSVASRVNRTCRGGEGMMVVSNELPPWGWGAGGVFGPCHEQVHAAKAPSLRVPALVRKRSHNSGNRIGSLTSTEKHLEILMYEEDGENGYSCLLRPRFKRRYLPPGSFQPRQKSPSHDPGAFSAFLSHLFALNVIAESPNTPMNSGGPSREVCRRLLKSLIRTKILVFVFGKFACTMHSVCTPINSGINR